MAVSILAVDWLTGPFIQPGRVEDNTFFPVGGPIRYWASVTGGEDQDRKLDPCIFQTNNKVFIVKNTGNNTNSQMVFELIRDAETIGVDESSAGSPAQDETITGGTSGATGTFKQFKDSILYFVPVSGTFQSGETISFSGAGTNVTSNTPPQQSQGGGDDTGEWIYVDNAGSQNLLDNTHSSTSQPMPMVKGNSQLIAFFRANNDSIFTYDVNSDTWNQESTSLFSAITFQSSIVFKNKIFVDTDSALTVSYDPATETLASTSNSEEMGDMLVWRERLFRVSSDSANLILREFLGGAWNIIISRSSVVQNNSFDNPVALVHNDALYVIYRHDVQDDWMIVKLVADSGDIISVATDPDSDALSKAMLPSSFTDGGSLSPGNIDSGSIEARWEKFYEQLTNGATSEPNILLKLRHDEFTNQVTTINWGGLVDLTDTNYTWDGTTTVEADATPTEISVGDFIALKSDTQKRSFEITDITSTTITIANPESITIPSSTGSETSQKESQATVVDTSLDLRGIQLPHQGRAGGEFLWKAGRISGRIIKRFGVSSAIRVFFSVTHPDGVTDLNVKLYFGDRVDDVPKNLATISNLLENGSAPGGTETITANEAQNLSGDGTTEWSVDWDSDGDGVGDGDTRSLQLFITES